MSGRAEIVFAIEAGTATDTRIAPVHTDWVGDVSGGGTVTTERKTTSSKIYVKNTDDGPRIYELHYAVYEDDGLSILSVRRSIRTEVLRPSETYKGQPFGKSYGLDPVRVVIEQLDTFHADRVRLDSTQKTVRIGDLIVDNRLADHQRQEATRWVLVGIVVALLCVGAWMFYRS